MQQFTLGIKTASGDFTVSDIQTIHGGTRHQADDVSKGLLADFVKVMEV